MRRQLNEVFKPGEKTVNPEFFVGREAEVERALEVLLSDVGCSLVISGQQGVGRRSLVHQLRLIVTRSHHREGSRYTRWPHKVPYDLRQQWVDLADLPPDADLNVIARQLHRGLGAGEIEVPSEREIDYVLAAVASHRANDDKDSEVKLLVHLDFPHGEAADPFLDFVHKFSNVANLRFVITADVRSAKTLKSPANNLNVESISLGRLDGHHLKALLLRVSSYLDESCPEDSFSMTEDSIETFRDQVGECRTEVWHIVGKEMLRDAASPYRQSAGIADLEITRHNVSYAIQSYIDDLADLPVVRRFQSLTTEGQLEVTEELLKGLDPRLEDWVVLTGSSA